MRDGALEISVEGSQLGACDTGILNKCSHRRLIDEIEAGVHSRVHAAHRVVIQCASFRERKTENVRSQRLRTKPKRQ